MNQARVIFCSDIHLCDRIVFGRTGSSPAGIFDPFLPTLPQHTILIGGFYEALSAAGKRTIL